jgi:hypothetical protein
VGDRDIAECAVGVELQRCGHFGQQRGVQAADRFVDGPYIVDIRIVTGDQCTGWIVIEIGTGKAMFDFPPLNTYDFSLVSYLEGIRDRFVHLKSFSNPKILLAINNVQFFQLLS